MSADIFKRAGLFVAFVLAQALILGRIHLFGYATPLFYVYFVLLFPRNYPKWAVLLWSFGLGLVVDIFFNTPGVAAASMTLLGAIQPYYFELYVSRDAAENMQPSIRNIGWVKYFYYSLVMVLIYCLVFFTLDAFTLYNWVEWLKSVIGSAAITLLMILTFETVQDKQE
ncbi:MAG: rod shape-determining protein MreD [Prevotella sp.]|nr:rod shape-determining protein MreD [Prevotella sp.]MBQ8153614.1 rod shape-determining protein MreD [Prevotella sp.]MBQ8715512.1 rod shape-determining protein MreD [Prevotella sp.]